MKSKTCHRDQSERSERSEGTRISFTYAPTLVLNQISDLSSKICAATGNASITSARTTNRIAR